MSDDRMRMLKQLGTATLHEGLGQRGAMAAAIKPIDPGMCLAGRAYTVDTRPGDNLMIHLAVARAAPGDVLVVDAKGFDEGGHFGDILASAAQARGIAGLVIDGTVRDCDEIAELGFPVFARGLSIKACTKSQPGAVGQPIICAGVPVATGDLVVGDRDGVVVLPASEVDSAVDSALARQRKEDEIRARLRAGETTLDILGLRQAAEGSD